MARTFGSVARRVFVAGALSLGIGCGGGGGGGSGPGGGAGGAAITGVTPTNVSAQGGATVTITGLGFGAAGTAVVRVTAPSAVPFANGTASFADVPGTIVDDTTITFTSPAARLCPSNPAPLNVRVTLPGGTPIDSPPGIATLVGPLLGGAAPHNVPPDQAAPVSLNGSGFTPVGGAVTVRFTAATGTPFQGGTSAETTVAGTIASASTVLVTSPLATAGAEFSATVSITFADGSCVTVPALITFGENQDPTLESGLPEELHLALGDHVSFTVTVDDPDGGPVGLQLLNPPKGCTFPPLVNAPSPQTVTVDWLVDDYDAAGPNTLFFRATDVLGTARTLTVRTHLSPYLMSTLLVGDVTGDGKPDVVVVARFADVGGVTNVGAIHVWAGATTPSGTPTASLTVPGAVSGDLLAAGGVRLADVTGDGVLDVVAATHLADVAGVADAGALYVWKGGSGLTGSKSPEATLTAGPIGSTTYLAFEPSAWNVGDVSGDGVLDVVAVARYADLSAVDRGGAFLWRGGSGLTGSKTPDATLTSATNGAQAGPWTGLRLVDLSGDGTLDVFTCAPFADPGSLGDAGAMHMWKGGSGLLGTPIPDATMTAAGANSGDALGAQNVRIADVTADGVLDVVVGVSGVAVDGKADAGAIYVWKGGSSLRDLRPQDSNLIVPNPTASDALSNVFDSVLVGDVSGDGIADVVGAAEFADVGGTADVGAVYVWKGSSSLPPAKNPDATLTVTGATAEDRLGNGGVRLVDLTDDGILDVFVISPLVTVGGNADAGAAYVWAGGASLTGALAPTATLAVTGASTNDRLGSEVMHARFGSRFGDVTGDGILDAVVPATLADAGATDAGAIYVWKGGSSLTGAPAPAATLGSANPRPGDRLGQPNAAPVALVDVSGDGTLDVLAGAGLADRLGASDTGALYVWNGGSGLTGAKTPDAALTIAGSVNDDQVAGGVADGLSWEVADVTGDDVLDLVVLAPRADDVGLTDAGAAFVWAGGSGLTGEPGPTATFFAPDRSNYEFLGLSAGNELLRLEDVTGDGIVDLILGGSAYTGTGPAAQGGVFLWTGSSGLSGTPAPAASFLVPGAVASDFLGR